MVEIVWSSPIKRWFQWVCFSSCEISALCLAEYDELPRSYALIIDVRFHSDIPCDVNNSDLMAFSLKSCSCHFALNRHVFLTLHSQSTTSFSLVWKWQLFFDNNQYKHTYIYISTYNIYAYF